MDESYWLSITTKGYLNEYLTDDGSNEEELKKIFRKKYTEVIGTVSFESILYDSKYKMEKALPYSCCRKELFNWLEFRTKH